MPNDPLHRLVLSVTLSLHALMMACLAALSAGFDLTAGFLGALCAMAVMVLYPLTVSGAIAWVAGMPLIQALNGSASILKQLAAGALYLVALVTVVLAVTATWTFVHTWSYAGFAALSGFAAVRGFRSLAQEAQPPSLAIARLVN